MSSVALLLTNSHSLRFLVRMMFVRSKVRLAHAVKAAGIVGGDYPGPHLEGEVTLEFCMQLVEAFKDQKLLHKKYAFKILQLLGEYLPTLPTLTDVPIAPGGKITVCGDTHGQFYDLKNIFDLNGYPSEDNPYLFNGDFVDRGSFSIEVVLTLFAFKLALPNHFHLSRGNHETINMNKMYGFEGEVSNLNMHAQSTTRLNVLGRTVASIPQPASPHADMRFIYDVVA